MHSKNEGKEKEVQDIEVLEVSTNTNDAKVQSKPNFDSYKDLYKDVISDKCIELYGSLDDKDLWEDTAKEMYLQSEYYIPVKVEESKTSKEFRIIDTSNNKVLKVFSADEEAKGYSEMRKMGDELKSQGKEDNLIYREFRVKNKDKQEDVKTNTKKKMNESVDWDYYDKFKSINDTYLPDRGQGETYATQIVTAINKLIYKWYNDGDVYDNVMSGMNGWANDLSSYANWLYEYVDGTQEILMSIEDVSTDSEYEDLLKKLADEFLAEEFLEQANNSNKQGDIYECDGPFEFDEHWDDEDEDDDYWNDEDNYDEDESKKLNEKALIENTSSNEDFIQQCKDSGQYKKYHMGLIKRMLASGLTPNQVKQFVNPQFNHQQFIEIADGFKEGLTMDQIKLYANLKYCGGQMEEIKLGFINGLTLEQIKVYADPKYDECQMCEIEQGFIEGLTMEQVQIYAKPKFDDTQMRQIREGFKEGLTMEQVGIYANSKFDDYQMEEIKEGLQNGMTLEQINLYADPKFDSTQMEQIKYGFEDGLTMEQVMVYANRKYDWYQMHAIREGFEDGLTIEQVKTYADPKYDDFEMDAIREELVDKKLNEKKDKKVNRRLPNISKFIYDLDKDEGNAWSVQAYTKNGLGEKIIIVYRNGESNNTAEDIKKAVEAQYDKLQGEITENGAGVWFYLKESLQEAVRIYPNKIKTPDGYILTKVDDGTYENAFIPMYRNENGDDTLITDIDKYEIVEDVTLDESSKKETTIGELLQQIEDATSVSEIYTIGTSVQDEVFTKVVDDEIEAIEAEYPDVYEMDEDTEKYGDILQNLISCITSDFGPSEYDNIVKLDEARKCEEKDSNYKVGDIVKVPYKYGSYTPGEYVNAPVIAVKDEYITVEIPSKLELTISQLDKFQKESK